MADKDNVVKFPDPEFVLECNCGAQDFRLIVGAERPLKVEKVECGCGEWIATLDEVLQAAEKGSEGE